MLLPALTLATLLLSQQAPLEHFDPSALNARAIVLVHQGELASAEILLARAALLAPENAVIARNLLRVRALRDGKADPGPLPSEAAAAASTPALKTPAPPPLWPAR